MKKTTKLTDFKPLQEEVLKLRAENKSMKKAMNVIRFLAFKHEIQYWNDANGTDAEKLGSILALSREANWGTGDDGLNIKLLSKHSDSKKGIEVRDTRKTIQQ